MFLSILLYKFCVDVVWAQSKLSVDTSEHSKKRNTAAFGHIALYLIRYVFFNLYSCFEYIVVCSIMNLSTTTNLSTTYFITHSCTLCCTNSKRVKHWHIITSVMYWTRVQHNFSSRIAKAMLAGYCRDASQQSTGHVDMQFVLLKNWRALNQTLKLRHGVGEQEVYLTKN